MQYPRMFIAVFLFSTVGRGMAAPVTFAAIGDYGGGFPAAGEVAQLIDAWNAEFIITTGDNQYGDISLGSPDWERLVGTYYGPYMLGRTDNRYPLQTSPVQRFFPTVGNHDVEGGGFVGGGSPKPGDGPLHTGIGAGDKPGYLDYFHTDPGRPQGRLPAGVHVPAHSYYEFQWGPVHLFAIDADRAQSDVLSRFEQQAWLQQRLAESTAAWQFVYFHHSPYSSGPHGSHALMQWPFREWGADAVITGHDHNYERLEVDGLPYFISGAGGNPTYGFPRIADGSLVRYSDRNGALLVTADEHSAVFRFVATDPSGNVVGILIDEFTLGQPIPEPSTLAILLMLSLAAVVRFHGR